MSKINSSSDAIGVLYLVATPIGNLADITLRALDTLKQVDEIACEDTRHTKGLLQHYAIQKPLTSLHGDNETQAAKKIITKILQGKQIAYVSDAGTPAVSDPGAILVNQARAAQIKIIPIPGASAITSSISVAGFVHTPFYFHGFLPSKTNDLKKALIKWKEHNCAHVFFQPARSLPNTLTCMMQTFAENTRIVIAHELTKLYETINSFTLIEAHQYYQQELARGEYVLLIENVHESTQAITNEERQLLLEACTNQMPTKKIAPLLAKICGLPKNTIYAEITACKKLPKI